MYFEKSLCLFLVFIFVKDDFLIVFFLGIVNEWFLLFLMVFLVFLLFILRIIGDWFVFFKILVVSDFDCVIWEEVFLIWWLFFVLKIEVVWLYFNFWYLDGKGGDLSINWLNEFFFFFWVLNLRIFDFRFFIGWSCIECLLIGFWVLNGKVNCLLYDVKSFVVVFLFVKFIVGVIGFGVVVEVFLVILIIIFFYKFNKY